MSSLLSENVKLTKVQDHTAAGTSAVNSDSVNMAGWDGVVFISSFGTAAADNIINGAQSSDDADADAFADLLGTAVVEATAEDVWLDIYRPIEQYVRLEVVRGTSTTLESIWAIQYRGRSLSEANVTVGTIVGERHVSPIEGTK